MTFDEIFTFDNLYNSYKKCLKGVSWKTSVQNFHLKAIEQITALQKELNNGTYKSNKYIIFQLKYRGKQRECQSIHIRDRVVQKCLCDYCLIPLIYPKLIVNNFACQKGKGTEKAKQKFKECFEKYSKDDYCLQIDFKRYFANIRHDLLLQKLEKLDLDTRTLDLIKYLLKLYDNGTGIGLALGSQMSQTFALYFMSDIDNYVYHYKHMLDYGRYVDDIFVFSESKNDLRKLLINVDKIANKSCISLNDKKTRITKLSSGLKFLQCKFIKLNNNKTLVRVNKQIVYRMNHKINIGVVNDNDFKSWYNNYRQYDSKKIINSVKYKYNKYHVAD